MRRRILVTGASRGIGNQIVRQLAFLSGNVIFATARDTECPLLQNIKTDRHSKIIKLAMDVTSPESIDNAFKTIKKTENKIDVLINNAGQVALKDKNALSCDENSLKDCFQTNAIGPFLVTKTFLPLLVQSQNPKILNVTSYWGSMSDKNKKISSFLTSYRVSKAAANMLSKCLAIDLNKKKISVVSINPGWVNTEMGRFGGKFHPILSPEESAKGIIKLVDSVNLSMSGKFLNYDGSELSY